MKDHHRQPISFCLLWGFVVYVVCSQKSAVDAFAVIAPGLRCRPTRSFQSSSDEADNAVNRPSLLPIATPDQESVSTLKNPLKIKKQRSSNKNNYQRRNTQQKRIGSSKKKANLFRKLNRNLVDCQDASELLKLLQSTPNALTRKAGGGAMNMVNFSTAIHRLARHSLQPHARAPLLRDARFALLVAALAENMVPSPASKIRSDDDTTDDDGKHEEEQIRFKTRELSNTAWGLAKLKVVPPATAVPIHTNIEDTSDSMISTALEIRKCILETAKARRNESTVEEPAKTPWVPLVSKLAGLILDYIRFQAPRTIQSAAETGFQQQEAANLLWAWATSGRGEEEVFGQLTLLLIDNQVKQQEENNLPLTPQEWSNTIWATATAGVFKNHDVLLEFVATSMEQDCDFVARFKPQEISNTLWGVATILSKKEGALTEREVQAALKIERILARVVMERSLEAFKTQEITNTMWSFATLGFGLEATEEHELNSYVVLASDDLDGDKALQEGVMAALIARTLEILPSAKSQELNNIAWSLARLVSTSTKEIDRLLWRMGQELSHPRRPVVPQDIGTTLWGFATLSFSDSDTYRAVCSRLTKEDATACKSQELSNTVWAIATAEIEVVQDRDAFDTTLLHGANLPGLDEIEDPIVECFAIAARELMARPDSFKTQEIKDILWSFSKVGIRHPELFKSVAEHVVRDRDGTRRLNDFSPQGCGNLAWAFARQAQMSEDAAMRLKGRAMIANTNGRLAVYTTAYFDVGENLLQRLFLGIAETAINVHNRLSILKPQDLSNTAWTFAILGLRHESFAQGAIDQLKDRIGRFVRGEDNNLIRFKGQELANLLWALATLNVPVGDLIEHVSLMFEKLFKVHGVRAEMISKYFKRQELANIAWSCAVLGSYTPSLMETLYTGLLGSGEDRNPSRMKEIHDDGGLQPQEVMTLIYVQLALAKEGYTTDVLSLPPDFLGEWQSGYNSDNRLLGETAAKSTFDLNLTTSSFQEVVSDAFRRIGFDHSQEHVITTKGLSEEYGVDLLEEYSEVLSIDIADVEARIAIEVDGPAHYLCQIDQGLENDGITKLSRGKLEYEFGWRGELQRMNGPTALKHRLLTALGWKVISLPFWEWSKVDGDPKAEENYCRHLLESNL